MNFVVTYRYQDGLVETFNFTDKDQTLDKYDMGKMSGRFVRSKMVPVVGVRAEEIKPTRRTKRR